MQMQINPEFADGVELSFTGWVNSHPDMGTSLLSLVVDWLDEGPGLDAIGGEYSNLLPAILVLIDKYVREPMAFAYVDHTSGVQWGELIERRLPIVELDDPNTAYLTQTMFQRLVFRRLAGARRN